jgi:hypothetical protein
VGEAALAHVGAAVTIQTMIPAARLRVADTLIDVGTIVRPAAAALSIDPTTLDATPASPATIWTGACRVKKPTPEQMAVMFGDTDVTVIRRVLRVAHDVPEIRKDDIFTASVSGDPEVLRRSMRVAVVVAGSMNFYRDFGVEVIG